MDGDGYLGSEVHGPCIFCMASLAVSSYSKIKRTESMEQGFKAKNKKGIDYGTRRGAVKWEGSLNRGR